MVELKSRLLSLYKLAGCGLIISWAMLAAEPRQRIHGDLYDGSRFALQGNVRPSLARARDLGAVSGSLALSRLSLHFSMTASQNADLMQLLRLQQTRGSSQFHRWLTPEQYASRFGVNAKDVQRVTEWLESQGFTNVEAAPSRNVILFDGTAAQAQMAFNTSIHSYMLNGEKHYANSTAPELPKALDGLVLGIRGLHDFHPKPHAHPHFTSNISGNHFLVPDDLATIYDLQSLYGSGNDGGGVKIAIPGQTDIDLTDIASFRTAAGLPANVPQVILDGADPGTHTDDLGEADLDIEWAGGVARGAVIVYVNSSDVFTSLVYAITNNVANVIAVSYGLCEVDETSAGIASLNGSFQQANSQGITITAASGDDGAADCDGNPSTPNTTVSVASRGLSVDFPAASPYVTGVGGTSFTGGATYWNATNDANGGSAISYIPEGAWNDSVAYRQLASTGGGYSTFNVKPVWQAGPGVPGDGHRDVPDVSLVASPSNEEGGYLICSGGSCVNGFRMADTTLNVTGGTSASSPSFAGIVALLVQKLGNQGNINPNLYTLASVSTDAFHDVTTGNNIVDCKGGTPNCSSAVATVNGTLGYSAGAGYDQATGLGSVDAAHLISEWGANLQTSISPTTLSVGRGTSGTATVNLTETDFTANATFTCTVASPLTNTTCSIPGTLSASGSATLTITAGATAAGPWWPHSAWPYLTGLFMGLLAIGLIAMGPAYLVPRHKRMPVWAAAVAVLLVAGLSSCGSGGSSSTTTSTTSTVVTPETGVVTVVATSGNLTSTSTISVTVQ